MNNVTLIGRLTKDPELRYLPESGTPVSNFTLAVDKGLSKEKKQELDSKNQPTADFIRIIAWGKIAENAANYLRKGRLVGVQGRIQTGSYEKDGIRRYTTDVVVNQVEFLEYKDTQEQGTQQGNQGQKLDYDFGFSPTYDDSDIPF